MSCIVYVYKSSVTFVLSGLYCYPTLVRDTATWSKVKQNSDGLKSRCEMFDMTASSGIQYACAVEVMEGHKMSANSVQPRLFNLAKEEVEKVRENCHSLVELQVITFIVLKPFT